MVTLTYIKPSLLVALGCGPSDATLLGLNHFDDCVVPPFANIYRNFVGIFGDLVTVGRATRRLCPGNLKPDRTSCHAKRNFHRTNEWTRLLVSDDPLHVVCDDVAGLIKRQDALDSNKAIGWDIDGFKSRQKI